MFLDCNLLEFIRTLFCCVFYNDALKCWFEICSEEKGWYYGVNLRGKTLIILSAQLRGKREPISHLNRDLVSVPSAIMAATSQVTSTLLFGIHLLRVLMPYLFVLG